MKNMKKILVLIVLFSGFAASSFAQNTTASASGKAVILAPISITKIPGADLDFGDIALNSTSPGGTVVITPSATPTRTAPLGGVSFPSIGTFSAAGFTVGGDGNSTFAIGLPVSAVQLDGPSSSTMFISAFTSDPDGTGTLSGGTKDLYVGGTLTVGATQTLGAYTGSFDVTVNYN